ncbi:MAG TPA: YdcF family protein [Methylomirabilota bacterium]|nr:YdcF family protein [Methylomirabilota bacterium]
MPALGAGGKASRDRSEERRGADSRAPRGNGWIVHAAVLALCTALLAAGVFWGGFMVFATDVSALKAQRSVDADGIVVFTGGAERVAGAMELLTDGHARRLLISGVHPDTSARQIGHIVDAGPSIFDCCVDLDRRAANTIGNAFETAKWVRANEFGSLIVVTSAYHMPRSLAELGSAMPDVILVPYAVSPPSLDLQRWYYSGATMTLLLEEYLKYIAAKARMTLDEAGTGAPILAGIAP